MLADQRPEQQTGAFLRLSSPIDDSVTARVQRTARTLLHEATRQGRRPVFIFHIEPGPSQFHHCYHLARFIATELSGARTVAYVDKPLYGHAVLVALACSEIVMAPETEIGDVGRFQDSVPAEQRSAYVELVRQRRHVPEALALGMLDRNLEVLEVETPDGRRYVLPDGLAELRAQVEVRGHRPLKEAGTPGIFSAREARNLGIASRLADSPKAVVDAYGLPDEVLSEDPLLRSDPKAVLITVEGMISPILEQFLYRQLDRARAEKAELIILRIDSPGGFATTSKDIGFHMTRLEDMHSVAYIPRQALSGAAFVALGCDEILMHPDAQLGVAGPIELGEGGAWEHAPEKFISPLVDAVRLLAERTHRPPALAEAMVDRNAEVYEVQNIKTGKTTFMTEKDLQATESPEDWKKLRLVRESQEGRFLGVNGQRAVELGLASATVETFEQLKQRYGLQHDPVMLQRTWVDTLVYLLNSGLVTGALFVIGLVCLYIELHTPGLGVGGLLAGLCFLLFFWSRVLGGTAGWLEVLLFLAGVICLVLELFVIPGFGVFGITGILLALASIVLAFQTFPRSGYFDINQAGSALQVIIGSAIVFGFIAWGLSRYFHALPVFGRMVLRPPDAAELAGLPGEEPAAPTVAPSLMGHEGTTTTALRPAGKVRFGDSFVDVVAEGEFIARGVKVRVIEVSGNRVVVKEV